MGHQKMMRKKSLYVKNSVDKLKLKHGTTILKLVLSFSLSIPTIQPLKRLRTDTDGDDSVKGEIQALKEAVEKLRVEIDLLKGNINVV